MVWENWLYYLFLGNYFLYWTLSSWILRFLDWFSNFFFNSPILYFCHSVSLNEKLCQYQNHLVNDFGYISVKSFFLHSDHFRVIEFYCFIHTTSTLILITLSLRRSSLDCPSDSFFRVEVGIIFCFSYRSFSSKVGDSLQLILI